jgi:hypothetical protein
MNETLERKWREESRILRSNPRSCLWDWRTGNRTRDLSNTKHYTKQLRRSVVLLFTFLNCKIVHSLFTQTAVKSWICIGSQNTDICRYKTNCKIMTNHWITVVKIKLAGNMNFWHNVCVATFCMFSGRIHLSCLKNWQQYYITYRPKWIL